MELETANLILKKELTDKDIEKLHNNVLIHEETAKYMLYKKSDTLEETKARIDKWSSWDNMYWIFKKISNEPIGFLSFIESESEITNIGLCIGKDYIRKGYGKQVLSQLIEYAKANGKKMIEYSAFHENVASIELAKKLGFIYSHNKQSIRNWDNLEFTEDFYTKGL